MWPRYLLILSLGLSGCQHTRSFLHMDSNSPSPFLGLQLSVDSGHKTSDVVATRLTEKDQFEGALRSVSDSLGSERSNRRAELSRPDEYIATSDTSAQKSTLKYSFRKVDPKSGSLESAEVEDILRRM